MLPLFLCCHITKKYLKVISRSIFIIFSQMIKDVSEILPLTLRNTLSLRHQLFLYRGGLEIFWKKKLFQLNLSDFFFSAVDRKNIMIQYSSHYLTPRDENGLYLKLKEYWHLNHQDKWWRNYFQLNFWHWFFFCKKFSGNSEKKTL